MKKNIKIFFNHTATKRTALVTYFSHTANQFAKSTP